MSSVPFVDLKPQTEAIREPFLKRVSAVLDRGDFVLGQEVKKLEESAAEFLGVKHTIACASGSDALLLALLGCGLKPGEGVITTSFSFFATVSAITRTGGIPFFVDIEPDTFNLSIKKLQEFLDEECEKSASGAVHKDSGTIIKYFLPVHIFGRTLPLEEMSGLCEQWNLTLIEDAAQAFTTCTTYENGDKIHAGGGGRAGCFSFYPTKNLSAMGDAGLISTNDSEVNGKITILRNHGMHPRYYHHLVGLNSRMDSFQAVALNLKLEKILEWDGARQKIARAYHELLSGLLAVENGNLTLPSIPRDPREHTFHQFVIRCTKRDSLKESLDQQGIGNAIFYPLPLHSQPCFQDVPATKGGLPECEKACREVLALPIYPGLSEDSVEIVANAVSSFFS